MITFPLLSLMIQKGKNIYSQWKYFFNLIRTWNIANQYTYDYFQAFLISAMHLKNDLLTNHSWNKMKSRFHLSKTYDDISATKFNEVKSGDEKKNWFTTKKLPARKLFDYQSHQRCYETI